MVFYDKKIVEQVRVARQKGASLRALEKRFKVPNSTISKWLRDIESNAPNFIRARKREGEYLKEYSDLFQGFTIDSKTAKIISGLMYWCEGSKYPSSGNVSFTNSDQKLIKSFLSLLRLGFDIQEEKIRVLLQLHSTHNIPEVISYWSKLLGVPESQFYKPTITNPTGKMKRKGYMGTCTVRYLNVKLLLNLTGIFQSFKI